MSTSAPPPKRPPPSKRPPPAKPKPEAGAKVEVDVEVPASPARPLPPKRPPPLKRPPPSKRPPPAKRKPEAETEVEVEMEMAELYSAKNPAFAEAANAEPGLGDKAGLQGKAAPERDFIVEGAYESSLGPLDPFHCCPSKGAMRDGTICRRMLMALFAVVLLWCSSLAVALAFVDWIIASPDTDAVYSTCEYAYDVTKEEHDKHTLCVDRQLVACDDAYQEAADIAVAAVEANFEYNDDLLEDAERYQADCSEAFTTVQAALSDWQDGGVSYEIYYDSSVCTDDDLTQCEVDCSPDRSDNSTCTCDEVASMLGDISAVRSEAFTVATDYKSYSSSTVGTLSSYAAARAAYDVAYINNKTAHIQISVIRALERLSVPHIKGINVTFTDLFPDAELMVGCVSMRDQSNYTGCFPGVDSARELYDEIREDLDNQLAKAREGFQEYADATAEYVEDVAEAVDNSVDFYYQVTDWISAFSIDTSDLGPIPSVSDFYVSEPAWPSEIGITTDYAFVPGAGFVWKAVHGIFDQFLTNLTIASLGTVDLGHEWWDAMEDLLDDFPAFSPDDYNPPEYSDFSDDGGAQNVTEAAQEHEDESNAFIAKEAVALDAFAQLNAYEDDDYDFAAYNFSISDDAYVYASSLSFPFEPLAASDVDFNVWRVSFGQMAQLLVYFDLAYRAYKSFFVLARFYSRSGLDLPEADMRVDRGQLQLRFMSPTRVAITLATSPVVAAFLIGIFVVVFIIYLCQIYIPVYHLYVDGCVLGTTNGTFITNNLYSIAYNYAAEDGNQAHFNGIEEYNVQKADLCAAYATSSQEQQSEDELYLNSLIDAQRATRDDLNVMQQCLDEDTLDDLFEQACCGRSGYSACSSYGDDDAVWGNSSWTCPENEYTGTPYSTPSTYLEAAACNEPSSWDDWELVDAIFYCSDIPDCTVTCGGPNREVIKTATEQCGCMIEWMLHAMWFKFSIGFCIYTLMNASRILLTRALCKLYYKELSPKIYTYKATCDDKGNILAPRAAAGEQHFHGRNGALRKELKRVLGRYQMMAMGEIVVALLLNAPWIAFLMLASHDLEYSY